MNEETTIRLNKGVLYALFKKYSILKDTNSTDVAPKTLKKINNGEYVNLSAFEKMYNKIISSNPVIKKIYTINNLKSLKEGDISSSVNNDQDDFILNLSYRGVVINMEQVISAKEISLNSNRHRFSPRVYDFYNVTQKDQWYSEDALELDEDDKNCVERFEQILSKENNRRLTNSFIESLESSNYNSELTECINELIERKIYIYVGHCEFFEIDSNDRQLFGKIYDNSVESKHWLGGRCILLVGCSRIFYVTRTKHKKCSIRINNGINCDFASLKAIDLDINLPIYMEDFDPYFELNISEKILEVTGLKSIEEFEKNFIWLHLTWNRGKNNFEDGKVRIQLCPFRRNFQFLGSSNIDIPADWNSANAWSLSRGDHE